MLVLTVPFFRNPDNSPFHFKILFVQHVIRKFPSSQKIRIENQLRENQIKLLVQGIHLDQGVAPGIHKPLHATDYIYTSIRV